MIGPEIRVWEFAKNLSAKGLDVTLAVPNTDVPAGAPFEIRTYTEENIRALTKDKSVGIVQGDVSKKFFEHGERIPTVCDLYDPYVVECLHLDPVSFPEAVASLRSQLLLGDFFLCATQPQRLFYVGMLMMLGRIDPANFVKFNKFENLIDLVPFGTSKQLLNAEKKETESAEKIIFLGGVYGWYDPRSALDCLKKLVQKRKDIRFMFIRFPFDIKAVKKTEETAMKYAAEIGVRDYVIFGDWVPYEDREKLYSRLDIALVIHKESLESMLSFRTRVLDFLSFGVPVITNRGGDLESLIEEHRCGIIIPENNPDVLADAILSILEDRFRTAEMIERGKLLIRRKFLWDKVIEPLEAFCKKPQIYSYPDNCTGEFNQKHFMPGHKSSVAEAIRALFKGRQ